MKFRYIYPLIMASTGLSLSPLVAENLFILPSQLTYSNPGDTLPLRATILDQFGQEMAGSIENNTTVWQPNSGSILNPTNSTAEWQSSTTPDVGTLDITHGTYSKTLTLDTASSALDPWTYAYVGGSSFLYSASESDGLITISADGYFIGSSRDYHGFAYQEADLPVTLTALLTEVTGTKPKALGGLMIRENLKSRHARTFIGYREDRGLVALSREGSEYDTIEKILDSDLTPPVWLRMDFDGKHTVVAWSSDGSTWKRQRLEDLAPFENPVVGLAVSAQVVGDPAFATFAHANVLSGNSSQNSAPIIHSLSLVEQDSVSARLIVNASDENEDNLNFSWTALQSPAGANPVFSGDDLVTVNFDRAGSYEIGVTVNDGRGGADDASIAINVEAIASGITVEAVE